VIRCPAAKEEECRACVSLIKVVRRRGVAVHVLKCVSTLKRLKDALQKISAGIVKSLKGAQGDTRVLSDEFFERLSQEARDAL